jgi:exodeoxyribonuclease V beta subunit
LLDNYRSTGALIDACNQIFDQKAPEPLFNGEIAYDAPVRCGRPDRRALDAKGKPVIPVVVMRYKRADGEKASAAEARAAIGRELAVQLRALLNDDAHALTIQEDGAAPRKVKAADVYVLTRTRAESAEIGEYLREAGVPFAFYKQDGLFQTAEAGYILDVLRAVSEPHIRSNRLKAWVSPFFAQPLRELALMEEVPPANPLNERLYEWKGLAERGRFAKLFDGLLHQSGLAYRELLLAASERRLTNYLHIFEILLAQALARRLALPEIIALLEDYIAERALPEVEEGNTQRVESQQDAVSVITVHMSKGLEADVVALFGGMGRPPDWRNLVAVYHGEGLDRRFAIGQTAKESNRDELKREERDENHRLLYVALTRARARLYLPLLPENSPKKDPDGYYSALNQRLRKIVSEPRGSKATQLFTVQDVPEPLFEAAGTDQLRGRLAQWIPPAALMKEDGGEAASEFAKLRRGHAPLAMRSYTSLRGGEEEERWDIPAEEFKSDIDLPGDEQDLPGGREVGIFLHEVLERAAMESIVESPTLEAWRQRDDVKGLVRAAMRRHQIKEPWFERGTQAVFNALSAKLAIGGGRTVGPIYQLANVRELEFVYPIPEASHPLLAALGDGSWTVERGYLKGFVDIVLEDNDRVYFADWKSDQLASYEADALKQHVQLHYLAQARIYSIGVIRLLQIRNQDDYEQRFGGLLYIFLRGMDGSGRRGVYFARPAWSEVCDYESYLMKTAGAGL